MSKVIFFNYWFYASNRPNPKTKLRRQKGNMFQELKPGNVDFTFILMRDFRENREIHISVLFFWTQVRTVLLVPAHSPQWQCVQRWMCPKV